jgi:diguanylate cyclase (GGDEF)-like protein/PAS domain S-box-containing protein
MENCHNNGIIIFSTYFFTCCFQIIENVLERIENIMKRILSLVKKSIVSFLNNESTPPNHTISPQILLENNPIPTFYKDNTGLFTYCNASFTRTLGLKEDSILGKSISNICKSDFSKTYYNADIQILKYKETQQYPAKIKFCDNKVHDVLFIQTPIIDSTGVVQGMIGNMQDIAALSLSEKNYKRMLTLKEAMLELNNVIIKENNMTKLFNLVLDKLVSAMENADMGCVLILNTDNILNIVASKGYAEKEVKDFTIRLDEVFYMEKSKGKIGQTIIINNIQNLYLETHKNILDSTDLKKLQCSISTPIMLDGKLYGFMNVESTSSNAFDESDIEVMDYLKNQIEVGISKNKLYEEIIHLSRFDKLTNVFNRRYFEELFDNYIADSSKNNTRFSLAIFDLNGLKTTNDTYGHLAGDELIKSFVEALKATLNDFDILGRFGGDEFAAVFLDDDINITISKMDNLINNFINCPININGTNIVCSFSYGIARFPEDGKAYKKLLKIADDNMYLHKKTIKT